MDTDAEISGIIKWFDPGKGFGFIVGSDSPGDILLHANVLRNFGQNSVAEGAKIKVVVQRTDRGLQAVEILSIAPPDVTDTPPLGDLANLTPEKIAESPVSPARVKWFDKAKGFGFANAYQDTADIFIHIEVLRRSGLADLMTGEAIAVRTIEGPRGLMAIEILPWEASGQ